MSFFAGEVDDPFFFDIPGFLRFVAPTNLGQAPDPTQLQRGRDTFAGYNTLAEVLRVGRRALVVPRAGSSAEQRMRSQLFLERGLVDVVFPEELSPQRLAERMLDGLERNGSTTAAARVDTSGLRNVAGHLLRLAGAPVHAQP